MIIQAAADFHGKESRYKAFLVGLRDNNPDVVVLAGDVDTNSSFFEFLDEIKVPTLIIHGNVDSICIGEEIKEYDNAIFLHEKMYNIDGINFVGAGGSNPILSDISLINTGKRISLKDARIDVLVTHIPPKYAMDRMALGLHIGSRWIRNLMDGKNPRLILCGHVHEDPGYAKFGKTTVVNCSIGKRGRYSIIEMGKEINDEITVDMF